jgi:site-specific recombinase XerD
MGNLHSTSRALHSWRLRDPQPDSAEADEYAAAAGIEKRVYPHLFQHQIITFLTRKGIISPKLQLLSGHAEEKSLAIYRDLALADVSADYEQAMRSFPVR